MKDVFTDVDNTFNEAVADLSKLCGFASTRDNEEATLACAAWLKARFEQAGFESRLLSVPGSYPLVYASMAGETERRLLFSNHYDVEVIGKPNEWTSPPFEPVVRNGRLYGRGTADNKGSLMARLRGVESTLRARSSLPCGVAFAVESKIGIFAPHFELILSNNRDLFRADACLWENALNNWDGRPTLRLGDKGMCALELKVKEDRKARLSSQFAALQPGAAWQLIWALSALRSDGSAAPEWLAEGVVPLSTDEYALLDDLPIEPPGNAAVTPENLEQNRRLRQEPTCNLSSITAGSAPGKKAPLSAIPEESAAYVDLRILPEQDPDRIVEIVHSLVARAAPEIQLKVLGKLRPHRTPLEHPFIDNLGAAARRVWDAGPRPEPLSTSSGTRYALVKHFDIPIVGTGIAYPGSEIGLPNENVRLEEDYKNGIKFMAALLEEFGKKSERNKSK